MLSRGNFYPSVLTFNVIYTDQTVHISFFRNSPAITKWEKKQSPGDSQYKTNGDACPKRHQNQKLLTWIQLMVCTAAMLEVRTSLRTKKLSSFGSKILNSFHAKIVIVFYPQHGRRANHQLDPRPGESFVPRSTLAFLFYCWFVHI